MYTNTSPRRWDTCVVRYNTKTVICFWSVPFSSILFFCVPVYTKSKHHNNNNQILLDVFTLFFVFTFSYNLFESCYSWFWPRAYTYIHIVNALIIHLLHLSEANALPNGCVCVRYCGVFMFACVDDTHNAGKTANKLQLIYTAFFPRTFNEYWGIQCNSYYMANGKIAANVYTICICTMSTSHRLIWWQRGR